ncbi:carboxymuconolactone decarboxylase family protein [Micromonospora sp. KLBMP9576]|uniref:carboxymuconolactone decarboxylase family protein n=1 Tax=Micromonospora sp. KLBMP9576 TaxID=3424769 RepID=UPI003D900981
MSGRRSPRRWRPSDRPLARLTRRITQRHIERLTPVRVSDATGEVRYVYRRLEQEFGLLAPPVALHAAAPAVLAGCWLMLREALLVHARVGRDTKEAVAAAVSLVNRCPYCVDVHGTALHGLLRGPDARALTDDRLGEVREPRLRAVAEWFRHGGAAAVPAHLGTAEVVELIGVSVLFHYLNRMVNVFLTGSPLPAMPPAAARVVHRLAAVTMARLTRRRGAPGADLDLLPPAPVPPDLDWAHGNPILAAAFARAAVAIDAAGRDAVPAGVRSLVLRLLAGPDGLRSLTDRAGVDAVLATLPEADRAAGRLALNTAFFSWRVTDAEVAAFRVDRPGDRPLVELVSWASLAAARRAGHDLWAAWQGSLGAEPSRAGR